VNRITAVLAVATLALVVPTTASAKGPREGIVSGPGLKGPIRLTGLGGPGSAGTLGRVAQHGGLIAALGGSDFGTLVAERPPGGLGPRYTVTFVMLYRPARTVIQHLYPYAQPRPLTYTPPGQEPFGTAAMGGGWFVAGGELKAALTEAGLPRTAPATAGATAKEGGFEPRLPLLLAAAGIALLLALAGVALLARRRLLTPA
jgi:hypothetical protein